MQKLLLEAKAQLIDSSGKCRALYFSSKKEEGVLLYVKPIPPCSLKEIRKDKLVGGASLDDVVKFCKSKDLTITANIVNQGQTIGVKVKNNTTWILQDSYIPVKETPRTLQGIPTIPSGSDPLLASGIFWPLTDLRLKRRTATVLKAYVLWTYSRHLQGLGPWNKEKSFVVINDPESIYMVEIQNLGSRLFLDGNTAIYSEEEDPSLRRIKVTSEEIITKLLKWLKVQTIREADLVNHYWENNTIPDLYKTISDFRQEERQLVFVNKNGMLSWIKNREDVKILTYEDQSGGDREEVSKVINTRTTEPYFYFLGSKLVIIQNVKRGKRLTAEAVAWYWHTHRVNQGHSPIIEKEKEWEVKLIDYANPPSTRRDKGPIISSETVDGKPVYFAVLVI